MKNLYILITVPLAIAVIGCHDSAAPKVSEPAVVVQTTTVRPADQSAPLVIAGVVRPHVEADIASQIVAPVSLVTKREGDRVRRGEVLVRLHAPALNASAAQAGAILVSAEDQQAAESTQAKLAADTLARYMQLRQRHSVTAAELEQIQAQSASAQAQQRRAAAQVSVAQSALAMQRANASDAVLYAPFDGVVTKRLADPGTLAVPGIPLLHMQSTGHMEVDFSITEELVQVLHAGETISIALSGTPSVQATITNISPAGDAASHSFIVKAALPPSSPWNTGAVVQVLLPSNGLNRHLLVASQAVVQEGGLDAVLIATADGHAEVRYVTLGHDLGAQTEVLSGLHAGDRVLTRGELALAGKKIEVRP